MKRYFHLFSVFVIGLLSTLILVSCYRPTAEDVNRKINNYASLTTEDYDVIIDYMMECNDGLADFITDIETPGTTEETINKKYLELSQTYPYSTAFGNKLDEAFSSGSLNDSQVERYQELQTKGSVTLERLHNSPALN